MMKVMNSKPGQWLIAALVGGLMGFIIGPAVSAQVTGTPVSWGVAAGLAVIGTMLMRLAMDLALSRSARTERSALPVAAPDRKAPRRMKGKVDELFGEGNVTYSVVPGTMGEITIVVRTKNISGQRFKRKLVPLLDRIDGIDWMKGAQARSRGQKPARDSIERQLVSAPADNGEGAQDFADRSLKGTVSRKASLASVVEELESLLGSPAA